MRSLTAALGLLALAFSLSAPAQADAQDYYFAQKTYKVQVEYWFFDTDYYYWRTVFETPNLEDAEFMYELLLLAKQNHQLNQAAPNEYWRYIAVDVRLITVYHYPRYQPRYPSLILNDAAISGPIFGK